MALTLPPPPKFGPGTPAPRSDDDWNQFIRWLYAQYKTVQTLAGTTLPPNTFPVSGSQWHQEPPPVGFPGLPRQFSADPGDSIALLAGFSGQPRTHGAEPATPNEFPAAPYRIPHIFPTLVDTIANQTNYDPAPYANCLYLASDTFLLYYSSGTAWVELTPTMGGSYPTQDVTSTFPNPKLNTTGVTAATYGDATHVGQFTVDAKGRLNGAAAVPITFPGITSAQIIAALGYTPADAGANSTFSLTSDLITGIVSGTITQT